MPELTDFILHYEKPLRMGFFVGMLLIMGLWEWRLPARQLRVNRLMRWSNNLLLVVANTLVLRLVFPAAAVGMAAFVSGQGWGLFNYTDWPLWLELLVAVILMDFFIYLQHVMVHAIPALWRLHRVHHADPDFDVTTGLRFHPLEIILSMLIKFAFIIVLGAPVVAVIIFELLLNVSAMFNHGNVRLPSALDRLLRWIIVTPDMHRVHHSVIDYEANSNYGFFLPWWDRLLGTYQDQPGKGHAAMEIGVHGFTERRMTVWLSGLLLLPFVGKANEYVINRRQWSKDEQ